MLKAIENKSLYHAQPLTSSKWTVVKRAYVSSPCILSNNSSIPLCANYTRGWKSEREYALVLKLNF